MLCALACSVLQGLLRFFEGCDDHGSSTTVVARHIGDDVDSDGPTWVATNPVGTMLNVLSQYICILRRILSSLSLTVRWLLPAGAASSLTTSTSGAPLFLQLHLVVVLIPTAPTPLPREGLGLKLLGELGKFEAIPDLLRIDFCFDFLCDLVRVVLVDELHGVGARGQTRRQTRDKGALGDRLPRERVLDAFGSTQQNTHEES